jgi:hypothetical protein
MFFLASREKKGAVPGVSPRDVQLIAGGTDGEAIGAADPLRLLMSTRA